MCGSSFDNPAYGKLAKNDLLISVNGNTIKTRNDLTKTLKKTMKTSLLLEI